MRLHDLERILRRHGFALDHISGSHRVYFDQAGRRLVTCVHPGREIQPSRVAAIRRDLEELAQRGEETA
jgi:predicted RNA binding protein YcfA (HicA-like mRNA interferase family)